MDKTTEKRKEQRLHYRWPVKLMSKSTGGAFPGQMVDICSLGAAFYCHAGDSCPGKGQQVAASFSVPRVGSGSRLDKADFTRVGQVCRVNDVNNLVRQVAIQFANPLSFKPGEQDISETSLQQWLETVPRAISF